MEAKKFGYECVLMSMDMPIIVWKHTQKNLHENIMSRKSVAHVNK
jgi:hypothetical protein